MQALRLQTSEVAPLQNSQQNKLKDFLEIFWQITLELVEELCLSYLSFISLDIVCLGPFMASLDINDIYGVFMVSRSLLGFPPPHLLVK